MTAHGFQHQFLHNTPKSFSAFADGLYTCPDPDHLILYIGKGFPFTTKEQEGGNVLEKITLEDSSLQKCGCFGGDYCDEVLGACF